MNRKEFPQSRHNALKPLAFNYAHAIGKANALLHGLKVSLENTDVRPFDCDVGNESPSVVFDSLVKNRIVKKFNYIDGSRDCRDRAFTNYRTYEEELLDERNLLNHVYWRKVKLRLMRMLKWFEFDVTSSDIEFTPGESYVSSGGEVSIIAKLHDPGHWTTTWNCLDLTLDLIWSHPSLKSVARLHIDRCISHHERKRLWDVYSYIPEKDRPKYIFFLLLKTYVLTIVDGARASSVPKNIDTDRFINVEATFPVILQRLASKSLKRCLKKHGNNLSNVRALRGPGANQSMSAQELHGWLIQHSWNSTVDFSNASDSVLTWVVGQLFPQKVSSCLFHLRSHFVDFNGDLFEPKKLSSMGNGYTFEVMTCLLYAMSQEFDKNSRVYGDDVIINTKYAHCFIEKCKIVGFMVNEKKTFINTKFRESCGYFHHDDFGYLTTFDFSKCITFADVIVSHNKLVLTCEHAPKGSVLVTLLQNTIQELRLLANASHLGPIPITLNAGLKYLASYMFHENSRRKHKNSANRRDVFRHHIEQCADFFTRNQLSSEGYVIVNVPVFVPALSREKRHQRAVFIASLYSGRSVKASKRGRGRWVNLPAFVAPDGFTILVRDAKRDTKTALFHDNLRPLGYRECRIKAA